MTCQAARLPQPQPYSPQGLGGRRHGHAAIPQGVPHISRVNSAVRLANGFEAALSSVFVPSQVIHFLFAVSTFGLFACAILYRIPPTNDLLAGRSLIIASVLCDTSQ